MPVIHHRSFGVAGTPLSDGHLTPLAHDGMAAYRNGNMIWLVRNHEDRNAPGDGSTAGDPSTKYDPLGGGGTTTLVIHPATRELVRDFISLNSTIVNCAGGPTPWKSWLTCEETTGGPTQGWEKPHGEGGDAEQFLRGIIPTGAIFDFAENLQNDSEWAGATFIRADGHGGEDNDDEDDRGHLTLFVNRQGPTSGANPPMDPENHDDMGMTFAIWGPWKKGAFH